MKVVNNHSRPLALEDGTILAAAGTPGATKTVKRLGDKDRKRYLDTGRIAVIDDPPPRSATRKDSGKEEAS